MKTLLTYAAAIALTATTFSTGSALAQEMDYSSTVSGSDSTSISSTMDATADVKNIVGTAMDAEQFSTLASLIQTADLVAALEAEGPFTVFAPTNEAFAKLSAETLDSLQQPENKDQLVGILTYHVVSGKVMSGDISGQSLSQASLQGGELNIDATDGVTVNNVTVVAADIETSNGVIHAIDTVLMPE